MKRRAPLLLCALLAACTQEGDTIIIQQIAPSSSSAAEASMSSSANAYNPLPSSGSLADASSSQNTDYSSSSANEAQSSGGGIGSSEASSSSSSEDSLLRDARDGQTYRTVVIGTQMWMAENLNYKTEDGDSRCYPENGNTNTSDADNANCNTYGRLYTWATAMNGAASSTANPSGRQGVCPSGWHIPSHAEWTKLTDFVGGASTAGAKLKAASGWNDYNGGSGSGTDEFGFAALPGGLGLSNGFFDLVGLGGWWSSTGYYDYNAWFRSMRYDHANVGEFRSAKSDFYSVRCVQDAPAP